MQRWKHLLFNIVLCLNCLLLFCVIAGDRLHIPAWIQVVGRMHPLLLHFPIVLLLLYIFWSLVLQAKNRFAVAGPEDDIAKWLLLATAFTAALTALMGLFLSKEEGYHSDALWWHKWGGVAVSLFSFLWYTYRNSIHQRKYLPQIAAVTSFILIVFTGHQGSNITHGENYLLAPVTPEKIRPVVPFDRALVFADMVKPILEAKCMSCHNNSKAKGELVMETEAALLKGGKHGILFTAGQPDLSLLMQRIHLPDNEKKHMPPAGKPQLDDDEVSILFGWIKDGASFSQKLADLPATDSLKMIASTLFHSSSLETYDFAAADEKQIQQLNNTNRLIQPVALGSPALAVNFYNRQNYTTASLKDILPLKNQVVSLDMAYMPLTDEDLSSIAQFTNLRKLNLNFSTVPVKNIAVLSRLPLLNHISLSGTKADNSVMEQLARFPKLRWVYLWNDPVTEADLLKARKMNAGIKFETGPSTDTVLLRLNAPILETDARIVNVAPLALTLRHYIKGATMRYTLDGTIPDSIYSPVYDKEIVLTKEAIFKARAFKPGWLGSDPVTATFYKNSFIADSIRTLTPLDSTYKGKFGARTLINGEKGDYNFRNGKWLGFRRNDMEMLLHYPQPVTVSQVTISSIVDAGGYLMPPVFVEVWGGSSEQHMTRLASITPHQPDSLRPAAMVSYDGRFKPTSLSFIKVVAKPVNKLPSWHPGKGKPAWFFTDEILVN